MTDFQQYVATLTTALLLLSTQTQASESINLKQGAILERHLAQDLRDGYAKNLEISQILIQIKKNHKFLLEKIKDRDIQNLLSFISIRLNELEALDKLPMTEKRLKRVADISSELMEADRYITTKLSLKKGLNIALLSGYLNR